MSGRMITAGRPPGAIAGKPFSPRNAGKNGTPNVR